MFTKRDKLQAFFLGIFSGLLGLIILALILWQLPAMQQRLGWRIDFALTYLRGIVDPVKPLPMAVVTQNPDDANGFFPTPTPTAPLVVVADQQITVTATVLPTLTSTAIPGQVQLPPPAYEKQEINNCGPATLAMYLRV